MPSAHLETIHLALVTKQKQALSAASCLVITYRSVYANRQNEDRHPLRCCAYVFPSQHAGFVNFPARMRALHRHMPYKTVFPDLETRIPMSEEAVFHPPSSACPPFLV